MCYLYSYSIFPVNMLCKVLRRIYRTVLSAGAPEAEHQRREAALYVSLDMMLGKLIHRFEKFKNLTVILKESYHWLVKSRQLLVWLIASGIMCRTTVEHVSATIA